MPKIVPQSIQTCFVLVLGQIFRKIFFAQCSVEGRVFENVQKFFFSKFQKRPKSFPKESKRVLIVIWDYFFQKIFAQFSMEGRVFENFQKNQKSFKFPEMPKIVLKSIQTCFERVLGQTFRKIFAQFSTAGRILENFQKNQKKISKFQKRPKSFPKVSKRVLNLFWVKFFEKFLCPVFRGGSSFRKLSKKNQKSFKFPKMPKIVPKSIQTCFERVLGQTFRKNFAQFSMEGRVFENFQKNQKNSKIPKMPKIVPQSIQTCFELVLGQIFRKIFLPSVPWRVEFSKMFKIFFFQNSKNAQNRSQKYPYVFRTCFGSNFSKHFCAQCSVGGRVFENFQKNQKSFKFPKMPKIVRKSFQTCFERVLGQTFRKIFVQFSMEGRVFENFQKKEQFQNSKNAQNFSQKYPNVS